ncbi:guanylin-like isoform X2 [Bombina bombina]|uniref:guanylin-like isoform X2 n=1 Tax=Bombina bombina TaxID=8345 RepID=UPI00235ACC41|nr:guanylin-like isoform X2 [Bombina bombina]
MKSILLTTILILLMWGSVTQAIKIQVGKFTYSLESVNNLKKLMEEDGNDGAQVAHKLCDDHRLPEEFYPVCQEVDAPEIFIKLVEAANNVDECEICANPACPGC